MRKPRTTVAEYRARIAMLERALEPAIAAIDRAETMNPQLHDNGTVLMRVADLRAARDLMGNIEPQPRSAAPPSLARAVPEPRLPAMRVGTPEQGPRRAYRFFRSAPGAPSQEGDSRMALASKCVADQQANGFGENIDLRQASCPSCSAPGFNSGWGSWRFICGCAIKPDDGSILSPCPLGDT